ncbi:type IV secretion system protein VirB11 [Nanoarchaeota archaeon]|nr:MAG: type IV secretion system protein VirB11 [Nanoarchaeota archaeon]
MMLNLTTAVKRINKVKPKLEETTSKPAKEQKTTKLEEQVTKPKQEEAIETKPQAPKPSQKAEQAPPKVEKPTKPKLSKEDEEKWKELQRMIEEKIKEIEKKAVSHPIKAEKVEFVQPTVEMKTPAIELKSPSVEIPSVKLPPDLFVNLAAKAVEAATTPPAQPPGYVSTYEAKSRIKPQYKAVELGVEAIETPKLRVIKELQRTNEQFPLVELPIGKRRIPVAMGHIYWDPRRRSLKYDVIEPVLSKQEKEILEEIKKMLKEKVDIPFDRIRNKNKAFAYLTKKVNEIIKLIKVKLSPTQKLKIYYYIYRDFVGLGPIEPLMNDVNIEDISCDGVNIPVFVYHRNPLYGQIETNIVFRSREELDNFVLRLAQKAGKALSVSQPLLDAALPDGSRIQATYGTDIARHGSNFTIRKFTTKPITPIHIMYFGTADAKILAYLWLAIENGSSILVAGTTATGKTTMLNVLSMFIPPNSKIISIEDTAELRLPHVNWIPEVARPGFGKSAQGEVSMFDLLKAAMRQRPDYLIVGEIRGKEAYVMFQGIATGHPAMGTLHADNFAALVNRLTSPPIELAKAMLENLDIVVFLTRVKRAGKTIRRIREIIEIVAYDYKTDNIITNTSYVWDAKNDRFIAQKSVMLDKLAKSMGYNIEELRHDLMNRANFLNWMATHKIVEFDQVAYNIQSFYTNPYFYMQRGVA